jgi:hypothetical protein
LFVCANKYKIPRFIFFLQSISQKSHNEKGKSFHCAHSVLSEQVPPYLWRRPASSASILNKSQDQFNQQFSTCPQPFVNPQDILSSGTGCEPSNYRARDWVGEAYESEAGSQGAGSMPTQVSPESLTFDLTYSTVSWIPDPTRKPLPPRNGLDDDAGIRRRRKSEAEFPCSTCATSFHTAARLR